MKRDGTQETFDGKTTARGKAGRNGRNGGESDLGSSEASLGGVPTVSVACQSETHVRMLLALVC
eukprot:553593-Rhodomonas_salina.3